MKSWDDDQFVTGIAEYLNFRPSSIWHLVTVPSLGNYVPLVNLSYAVDHTIGGLDGFMYHFQNVIWHIAACFGLFSCMRLLGVSMLPALLMTLLYTVHPQRTESVAWIAERRDVMCGAFCCWSAFCYLKFRERAVFSFSAFLLFLCACLSKPAALTFPVVLAMYEIWKTRSFFPFSKYRSLLPYFVLSLLVTVGTSVLQLNAPPSDSMSLKILKSLHNYSWYFLKNFYPGEMAPIYPKIVVDNAFFVEVAMFYFVLLALAVFMFFRFRKLFCFSLIPFVVAYAVTLLPTIGIVPVGVAFWDYADRYSYIPSAILAAAAALLLEFLAGKFADRKKFMQLEILLFSLVILLFSWITFFYNYTWKSYPDLIEITVAHNPPNTYFLCFYALNAFAEKKNDEAESCADYLLSVENENSFDCKGKSIYYTALALKAASLSRRGETAAALPLFKKALRRVDSFIFQSPGPFTTLLETAAGCYLKTGNPKMALQCYDAIAVNYEERDINQGLFHFYKGLSFYVKGNLKRAESEFSEAVRLLPDDENIKANLDEVRRRLKENKE